MLAVAIGRLVGVHEAIGRGFVVGGQLSDHLLEIALDARQGLRLCRHAQPADAGLGVARYATAAVQNDIAERRLRDFEPPLGSGGEIRQCFGVTAVVIQATATLRGGVDLRHELGRRHGATTGRCWADRGCFPLLLSQSGWREKSRRENGE